MKYFIILSALLLQGCVSNSKFSCAEVPTGGCRSVSEVYSQTNDGFVDYRQEESQKGKLSSKAQHAKEIAVRISQANRALNYANPGDPILGKPMILRILITPYRDEDGDYIAGGYVYMKIKDAEWKI